METTPNPFDLNRAIAQWRDELAALPSFRRENLDELESHLRDSIAGLEQRGLAADEAFWIANRRMGGGAALGVEFGKLNSGEIWLNRALWMLLGVQLYAGIKAIASIAEAGVLAIVFRHWVGSSTDSAAALYLGGFGGMIRLIIFGTGLMLVWRSLSRKDHGIGESLKRMARHPGWLSVGAIVGMILVNFSGGISLPLIRWAWGADTRAMANVLMASSWASLAEIVVMMVLTLWLARRQWLAKT